MINIEHFTYFLLIFSRMSGCVFFNQIFGRGNLPVIFKISLSLMLTITVYGLLPVQDNIVITSVVEYGLIILKEIFIGFIIGYIIGIFFSIVVIGGEITDLQIGMSMAQIYDPNSNVSVGVTGRFLNVFLILLFFSAGGQIGRASCRERV